jgi:hypothetical protein
LLVDFSLPASRTVKECIAVILSQLDAFFMAALGDQGTGQGGERLLEKCCDLGSL